jgi:hypothetical protein
MAFFSTWTVDWGASLFLALKTFNKFQQPGLPGGARQDSAPRGNWARRSGRTKVAVRLQPTGARATGHSRHVAPPEPRGGFPPHACLGRRYATQRLWWLGSRGLKPHGYLQVIATRFTSAARSVHFGRRTQFAGYGSRQIWRELRSSSSRRASAAGNAYSPNSAAVTHLSAWQPRGCGSCFFHRQR